MLSRLRRAAAEADPLSWSAERRERFWAKVDRRGDDECWRWRGRTSRNGFGRFGIRLDRSCTIDVYAHRAAWVLSARQSVPKDREVFHAACGELLCVNPRHLQIGSAQDRLDAAKARGAVPAGERHHAAKLTATAVRRLRAAKQADPSLRPADLAAVTGLTRTRLAAILRGEGWNRER